MPINIQHLVAPQHLVEDVKAAFLVRAHHDTTLFEQVLGDVSSSGATAAIKLNLHILSEARRVIVTKCLGVTKRLQHGVGIQQALKIWSALANSPQQPV